MAKIFSFASWNVQSFGKDKTRIQRAVEFVRGKNPDVFALFEVKSKDVFFNFIQSLPSHNFFITEDYSSINTLVGVNRQFTAFITQREEFKSKVQTLRPGALITLHINNKYYSILFLHLKSFTEPVSWGLRDDMIDHVSNLKSALDDMPGVPAGGSNFICMGDLNTMGMNLTYSDKDFSGVEELDRYINKLNRKKMRLLDKTSKFTWWNGKNDVDGGASNLDHVFASHSLQFRQFGQAEVAVYGWPELANANDSKDWIEKYSDHALLYGEVWE